MQLRNGLTVTGQREMERTFMVPTEAEALKEQMLRLLACLAE